MAPVPCDLPAAQASLLRHVAASLESLARSRRVEPAPAGAEAGEVAATGRSESEAEDDSPLGRHLERFAVELSYRGRM